MSKVNIQTDSCRRSAPRGTRIVDNAHVQRLNMWLGDVYDSMSAVKDSDDPKDQEFYNHLLIESLNVNRLLREAK